MLEEGGGSFLDEFLDCGNLGTGSIIAGRTVFERDGSVSKVSPGRVGSR